MLLIKLFGEKETNMKSILPITAIVSSLLALALVVWNHLNPPRWKADFGANTPEDVVPGVLRLLTDDVRLQASQAHKATHGSEIRKTLELVESSESGNHGIVFFRYSIGTDIFREAYWVGKVDGKWYWMPNLHYADDEPADNEWFEKMKEKKKEWEDESAKPKFE